MKKRENNSDDGAAAIGSDNVVPYIQELQRLKLEFSKIIKDYTGIGVITSALMFDGLMHRALIASENLKMRSISSFWQDELSIADSQITIFIHIAKKVDTVRLFSILPMLNTSFIYNFIDQDTARGVFRIESLSIIANMSSRLNLAIKIATDVTTQTYRDIANRDNARNTIKVIDSASGIAIAMGIAIGTFRDRSISRDMVNEDILFKQNVIKTLMTIYPTLAAMIMIIIATSKRNISINEMNSAVFWMSLMRNKEARLHFAQMVLKNKTAKESLKDIKLDAEALSSLCAAVCGAVARLKDMKNDFHFIMDCFKTLAWNPDFSETNIGAMKDISRKVVVEKTVKHSDGILFLKELGMPGRDDIYPKKGSAAYSKTKPKDSAGMEAMNYIDQIVVFDRILKPVVDMWGMKEMRTKE